MIIDLDGFNVPVANDIIRTGCSQEDVEEMVQALCSTLPTEAGFSKDTYEKRIRTTLMDNWRIMIKVENRKKKEANWHKLRKRKRH